MIAFSETNEYSVIWKVRGERERERELLEPESCDRAL
jgi:hypothetical protein